MTKLGPKIVRSVRGRGGNYKYRALKIDHGNFIWASEAFGARSKIMDVVYNATHNEMVRTKTLVKNCVVQVDATPFKKFYLEHYDVELGKKKKETAEDIAKREAGGVVEEKKKSRHVLATLKKRAAARVID